VKPILSSVSYSLSSFCSCSYVHDYLLNKLFYFNVHEVDDAERGTYNTDIESDQNCNHRNRLMQYQTMYIFFNAKLNCSPHNVDNNKYLQFHPHWDNELTRFQNLFGSFTFSFFQDFCESFDCFEGLLSAGNGE